MNRALLIGINHYVNHQQERLNGCINDANSVYETVVSSANFSRRLLINPDATKENIFNRLKSDLLACAPGDCFLFYFSGHGAQVVTSDPEAEGNKLDEVLCPQDFDPVNGIYIRDKDLVKILQPHLARGVNIEVVLDSCFSGGMDRGGFISTFMRRLANNIPPLYSKDRFIDVNNMVQIQTSTRFLQISPSIMSKPSSKFVLWSACEENQKAREKVIGGKVQGVFTHSFCQNITTSSNRTDLHQAIQAQIKSSYQNPRIISPNPSLFSLSIFKF